MNTLLKTAFVMALIAAPAVAQPTQYDPKSPVYEVAFAPGPKRFEYLGGPGGFFPDRAAQTGVAGQVIVDCRTADKGLLDDCKVVAETPLKYGFGDAALKMANLRAMSATPVDGVMPPAGERWLFVVRFPKPGPAPCPRGSRQRHC